MIAKNQKLVALVFLALLGCERNEPANNQVSKIGSEVDLASLKSPTPQNEPVPFEAQEVRPDSAEAHGLDSASTEKSEASDLSSAHNEVVSSEPSTSKTHTPTNKSEDKEKPAFLARECSSQNEGEMGFNAKEKRAYFCNGNQWVRLSRKLLKDQNVSGVNLENMHDKSFLCQKSATGGFLCMKATTYKNAH
ncbi:MAG: hypothetical protein WCI18_04285 [Pseudomonadota bacterium]